MGTDPPPVEEDAILTVLHGFGAAMHAWEKDVCTLRAQTDAKARLQAYKQLDAIFAQYCTAKDRKKDRQSVLEGLGNTTHASEYAPGNCTITQVVIDDATAQVYTAQPYGLENQYRYAFFKQNGDWKLDSKTCLYRDDGQYYCLFNDCFAWKTRFDSEPERAASAYARAIKPHLTGDNAVWHAPLAEIVAHFRQQCLHAPATLDIQKIGYSFDIYGEPTEARLHIDQPCHVIYHATTVTHDDLETWQETDPEFAHHNKLERVCYGYVVMDVIECALNEAKQYNLVPDTTFLVEAINYYNENDCFMEFEPPERLCIRR